MKIDGLSLISSGVGGKAESTFKAVDPSTGATIEPDLYAASSQETEQAAWLAEAAFKEYSHKSGKERATFLRAIAEQIEALGDTLTHRAMAETGLPEARIIGETGRTCGQLRLFASLVEEGSWVQARLDLAQADRKPLPKPDVRSMKRPLGPVTVFAASNFPLAFSVAGGDTAAALAAGCPVLVKAHASHPGTSELVGQAVLAAAEATSMPTGTFSLLQGSGRTVGAALVKHPAIQAVGFTGSTAGGTALMRLASERAQPIPVYAEMGSVNPVVILPGVLARDSEKIATGLQASATLGVGQFCTNPGVVLVEQSEAGDDFVKEFVEAMAQTPTATMLNPTIHKAYFSGLKEREAKAQVKTLLAAPREGIACSGTASVFEVSAKDFLADSSLANEIFGPETTLVRWSDKSELLAIAGQLEGQLTATVFGTDEDLNVHADLLPILERKAGRIIYNAYPTGVEVCHSMVHGGPYPATSDGKSTSVGTHAIDRFVRLVAYQGSPQDLLPDELKDANPLGIWRRVDGELSR